ncbi:hypothetical protein ACTD5D_39945 [Nocardia takedensis]|uniref:hypothetical protein n=1 Tax=Nocardia takedensis TaxID=259390 RepID=UPI003F766E75
MFEEWTDRFDPPSYRVVDPPQRVVVDLGQLIMVPEGFAGEVPLRVRSGGLSLTGSTPGLLHAWARTSSGGWIAFVTCVVLTGNKKGRVWMRQWCSQQAVRLADTQRHPPDPPRRDQATP